MVDCTARQALMLDIIWPRPCDWSVPAHRHANVSKKSFRSGWFLGVLRTLPQHNDGGRLAAERHDYDEAPGSSSGEFGRVRRTGHALEKTGEASSRAVVGYGGVACSSEGHATMAFQNALSKPARNGTFSSDQCKPTKHRPCSSRPPSPQPSQPVTF